jgi:hypothetical protein
VGSEMCIRDRSEVGDVSITPPAGGSLVVPPNGSVFLVRVAADTYDLVGQVVAE